MCLWEITRVFGKNNLVPTVTASFDVLEAGDMVEGCSIGFRFGVCGFGPVIGSEEHSACVGWFSRSFAAALLRAVAVRCRLCDPPTHCVSLVRECSDWGLA